MLLLRGEFGVVVGLTVSVSVFAGVRVQGAGWWYSLISPSGGMHNTIAKRGATVHNFTKQAPMYPA